ncbi:hypothetical protein BH11BAC1_BH11BAC1_21030 [soil metagenome]
MQARGDLGVCVCNQQPPCLSLVFMLNEELIRYNISIQSHINSILIHFDYFRGMKISTVFTASCLLFLVFSNTSYSQIKAAKADSMMLQESVMVTVEENFGPGANNIAGALAMIERKYQPFDNQGRTFAILDAYGYKMSDGRMHISMHISSEKAGGAQLLLTSSGKVLWNCKIYPKKDGTKTAGNKSLNIYIERENEKDKFYTVDGSGNPASIFNCKWNETKASLNDYWKDNTIKEFIFIYSACGCPVHVKFLRKGNKTLFQSGDNVIFPDDSGVLTVIHHLMGWQ